ncbi:MULTISPECIES: antitoxin VbhA family protein [unclassified Rhodococcus (in: high G+C Gram-positive bacteria)]|nr:antitoxin VbhA family protein [Rhodococcus sp. RS1C4]
MPLVRTAASERARAVDAARTSSALEGGRNTDATRADQDAYVHGDIGYR